ncbi:DUF2946 family protein [Pseudorhodoferax sp. Leaf274]|uniref:DUF2946 family protein n=1 Tax=Pseudorhodoferax sp. Leaf274 TaxID=1736318 RepID=UPI0007027623|nr:DUF2946 family protein [Pseudorhodoferax sp. Leaf274]KQP38109.1 hypothetical protein ASF44_12925 [Pseudorhodoferax sp. Leaf274]
MDDIVRQAIAKWPNVPACYGWLGLDARGGWYLRDAQVQATGAFTQGGVAKGDLLRHDKLLAFIGRNYACDARGCWFFQNGPQRVFVELEAAPWVWRIAPDLSLSAHTGAVARLDKLLLDEQGRVFALTDLGLGLVHSLDVELVASAVEQAGWMLEDVLAADLPARHGFVLSPQQLAQDSAAG